MTVNSTVGLHAYQQAVPVKVLGSAVFDVEGLSDQRPLDAFWAAPAQPDPALLSAFLRLMAATIQCGAISIRLRVPRRVPRRSPRGSMPATSTSPAPMSIRRRAASPPSGTGREATADDSSERAGAPQMTPARSRSWMCSTPVGMPASSTTNSTVTF